MRINTLMHKDNPCAVVALDDITGNIMSYKQIDQNMLLFQAAVISYCSNKQEIYRSEPTEEQEFSKTE